MGYLEEPQDRISDSEELNRYVLGGGIPRDQVKAQQEEPKCTCKRILVFLEG